MVSVSCFGVRVSVMFHFMFVHYTFSSVWVVEWPPFFFFFFFFLATVWEIAARSVSNCSYCILPICNVYLFPVLFLEQDLPFDFSNSCSLLFYYFWYIIVKVAQKIQKGKHQKLQIDMIQ